MVIRLGGPVFVDLGTRWERGVLDRVVPVPQGPTIAGVALDRAVGVDGAVRVPLTSVRPVQGWPWEAGPLHGVHETGWCFGWERCRPCLRWALDRSPTTAEEAARSEWELLASELRLVAGEPGRVLADVFARMVADWSYVGDIDTGAGHTFVMTGAVRDRPDRLVERLLPTDRYDPLRRRGPHAVHGPDDGPLRVALRGYLEARASWHRDDVPGWQSMAVGDHQPPTFAGVSMDRYRKATQS